MILKELLKKDFGVDLPISGGTGNSINNPIVIHKTTGTNDYVGTEYTILKCIGIGRNIRWKTLRQELLTHNNKKMDKIKIEITDATEGETVTHIENYYFDITECFDAEDKEETPFDENKTLQKIKDRLIELEKVNEFNKNCIGLIKTGELYGNSNLTSQFLEVLFKDEALPLFVSMMDNRKTCVLDVLRRIGKDLNENQGL